VLCFGGYFYFKNDRPKFNEPSNLDGWINLCNEDLNFLKNLKQQMNWRNRIQKDKKYLNRFLIDVKKKK
jgi:hypothetical protein